MQRLKDKIQEKVDKRVHGRKWKGSIQLETKRIFLQALPDACRGLISDVLHELVGCTVLFELVGIDAATGRSHQSGKKNMKYKPNLFGGRYTVSFRVAKDFGEPAALLVQSHLSNPFFLQHVTLKSADQNIFEFPCYSWIYNYKNYQSCDRIFFTNKAYLPGNTPSGLQKWRVQALQQLRGEIGSAAGRDGERAEHDRVYDYDVYNDLGNPDLQANLGREVLGGPCSQLPYPRRCKTGRSRTSADQRSEAPTMLLKSYYVPRDEQFDSLKNSSITINSIKSFIPYILPTVLSQIRARLAEKDDLRYKFSSFLEIFKLYSKISWSGEEGSGSITSKILEIGESVKLISKTIKQLLEDPIGYLLRFSLPQIIQAKDMYQSKEWKTDEEFGRQTLAGINPLVIERVKLELPKGIHVAMKLKGRTQLDDDLTVKQAIGENRLYIVDYCDTFLPFVEKVNKLEDSKIYASRTVLFLTRDGTLKPIAIELSLSENDGDSRVFFPPTENSREEWIWNLAKAHATINDAAYHELISHWLRTHACMEPFIIATHRTLSALHPINVLLGPHFKDTLQINALARQLLINAHKAGDILPGIIEMGFCTDKYSMEFSSSVYKKTWRLDEQALPRDLIKRGMAKEDPTSKEHHKLRLYVEDYPYAVDGLDIWFAIESWVKDYIAIYYYDNKAVEEDYELRNWWSEIKEQGHGDKKNESWWVNMTTREDLKEVIVTLIWIASAHHAAVNFGQYAYGGFMPNRPTRASKLIPSEGTADYENLMTGASEKFYLDSLSSQKQATVVMATLEILSNHAPNEEYLGQRTTPHWTSNEKVLRAFNNFKKQINDIEKKILSRNEDPNLKNRHGLVQVPYTLLVPSSVPGITGRGVPNSISI